MLTIRSLYFDFDDPYYLLGYGLFPPRYVQEMYAAASEPKELWIIDRAGGHVNPITHHEAEYSERVLKFFERAFAQE